MQPCVFFDRDGVLNDVVLRDGKPCSPRRFAEFRLVPGAAEAVTAVKRLGYLAIVVTNQPDIARGLMPPSELDRMHELLRREIPVDDLFVCPHDDADRCPCRKPKPGLLLDAAERHGVDLAASVMVGDTWKDIDAARAAGCTAVLLARDYNRDVQADVTIQTLAELPALFLAGGLGKIRPLA